MLAEGWGLSEVWLTKFVFRTFSFWSVFVPSTERSLVYFELVMWLLVTVLEVAAMKNCVIFYVLMELFFPTILALFQICLLRSFSRRESTSILALSLPLETWNLSCQWSVTCSWDESVRTTAKFWLPWFYHHNILTHAWERREGLKMSREASLIICSVLLGYMPDCFYSPFLPLFFFFLSQLARKPAKFLMRVYPVSVNSGHSSAMWGHQL